MLKIIGIIMVIIFFLFMGLLAIAPCILSSKISQSEEKRNQKNGDSVFPSK
jgi:flagellar basal body-associated protein FliL